MRVLLIEDNQELAGNICDFLQLQGLISDHASTGKRGLNLAADNLYDVIVLDVMMPGIDGFEVCQQLRNHLLCQTPILFLTARADLDDRLQGFEVGADDYLVKPFSMIELHYRLMALASRGKRSDIGNLTFEGIELNIQTGEVVRDKCAIKLNKVQFGILQQLIKNSPALVKREDLEYQIWGDSLPDNDILRSHIYQLRQLIDKPFDHHYIQTVHGKGIKLVGKGGER